MQQLKRLLFSLLSKRAAYRLGRALYMYGRGDVPNDMHHNGEVLIQKCVMDAWQQASMRHPCKLVIFDVGANVGDWSKALLQQLPNMVDRAIEIYCFEPVPGTNATLRRNLPEYSPLLHIEELALSSTLGTADIYVNDEANCGINSLHDDPAIQNKRPVTIRLTTATEFCKDKAIDHVQLIKCDTEGHDLEVILGALPLLRDGRVSVMQFEYNHRWIISKKFLRDVFTAIEGLPYKLAKLQPDHLLIFACWHAELEKFFEGNYALIHENAVAWFPVRFATFDSANTTVTSLSP